MTERRLIIAALDIFGRHGFEGTSTRMLAKAARANIAAISYYFGGKEGLYLAVADHISGEIGARVGQRAKDIRDLIASRSGPMQPEEARELLGRLFDAAAEMLLSDRSAPWARFIMREQMDPTEAFERIYSSTMGPVLGTARILIGRLLSRDAADPEVRLRTVALLGQILIFRVAHAAVLRQLEWTEIGDDELASVKRLVRESLAAISPAETGTPSR